MNSKKLFKYCIVLTIILYVSTFPKLRDSIYRQLRYRAFRPLGNKSAGYSEEVRIEYRGNVTKIPTTLYPTILGASRSTSLNLNKSSMENSSLSRKFATEVGVKTKQNVSRKLSTSNSSMSEAADVDDEESSLSQNNKTTDSSSQLKSTNPETADVDNKESHSSQKNKTASRMFTEFDISMRKLEEVTNNVTFTFDLFKGKGFNESYPILMNNEKLCQLPNGTCPHLLILVPSVRDHIKRRDAIRNTWAKFVYNGGYWVDRKIKEPAKIVFMLGGATYREDLDELKRENEKHGDIVVYDFVDSYMNLSLKMLIGLQWAAEFCDGVSHLVKVDDDTFAHFPQLIQSIKLAEHWTKEFALGQKHSRVEPIVFRNGRWKMIPEYPLPYYPRYVSGSAYVISGPSIKHLLQTSRRVPVLPNEDALVTGILAYLSNITRLSHDNFTGEAWQTMCQISGGYYASATDCCPARLYKLYHDVVGEKCDEDLLGTIDCGPISEKYWEERLWRVQNRGT